MVDTATKTIIEWGTTSDFKKLGGLRGKNKKELNASSLLPGTYGLVVFSPEKMPRPGDKNLVRIELKGHSIGGKEIFFSQFELWLKKSPLLEHEFIIEEKDAPATITLSLIANHVKVGIEIAANISRLSGNSAFDSSANLSELCLLVENNLSLSLSSPQLLKAQKKRLGRPFLYLASLHPHTRNQIATSLELQVPPGLSLHEECEYLLLHPKTGLCDRNKSVSSKLQNSTSAGNWEALILGMLEENCLVNMAEYAFSKMGDHMSDKQLQSLEIDALHKLALRSQKVIKDKGVPGEGLVDDLCNSALINDQVFSHLIKGGITDPVIHRFTIELVVRLRGDSNGDKPQEMPNYTPEEVILMLKERVFSPVTDSMLANGKKKVAKKAGTMAAKIGFNQFVLMAIIPPLGFAFLGYNIANAIFGESMNIVSAVVLQLLSQKLLLAAQGIYVPKDNN